MPERLADSSIMAIPDDTATTFLPHPTGAARQSLFRIGWRRAGTLTLALLAAATWIAAASPAATAEFSVKDGQILGRTLGYVGGGATGVAVVGIVFASANPASREEAELIKAVIGDGLVTGKIRLQARLVPADQLTAVTGIAALYVTVGLADNSDAIFRAAKRLQVPTISANLACVESGLCVVGFISEPTVQILINQGTSDRVGVHFLQAFRMLVREKQ